MNADLGAQLSEAVSTFGSADESRRAALIRQRLFPESSPVRINRFRVESRVAGGAMGTVYRGVDEDLQRQIAIKVLRTSTEDGRAKVLREARALARMAHPNVVGIYEVGHLGDEFYLVMEYVPGVTLLDWQRGQPWKTCLDAYLEVLHGLEAMHQAGLVHRDVKPRNLLMGDDGRTRVVDFGLVLSDTHPDPPPFTPPSLLALDTHTAHEIAGTPAYMAPEQFKGEPASGRSDQYSWCVALYEAIAGRRPYHGHTTDALYAAMRNPAEFEGLPIPRWLREALERGLAFDPADRFPDMSALKTALDPNPRAPEVIGQGMSGIAIGALSVGAVVVLAGATITAGLRAKPFRTLSILVILGVLTGLGVYLSEPAPPATGGTSSSIERPISAP